MLFYKEGTEAVLKLKTSVLLLSIVSVATGCANHYANQTVSQESMYDHGHSHTLHDGVVVPLLVANKRVGFAELKLHDDKGDLELWITTDKAGSQPLDLPIDSEIHVSFPRLAVKSVDLRVRNTLRNEDEDGKGNIRGTGTNYFIFPGDSGADASFLTGKSFMTDAEISFVRDGVRYTTDTFTLKPHVH